MTYGELKTELMSLGFEEEATMQEYNQIVIDAVNRSMQQIFDDIVVQLESYYKRTLSTEEEPWVLRRPNYITLDTQDSYELDLPANLVELIPLLAGFFLWLDDDQTKATLYFNMYETFRERVLSSCYANTKARIMDGGVKW